MHNRSLSCIPIAACMNTKIVRYIACLLFAQNAMSVSSAQDTQKMDFEKYDPVSTLIVPEHPLQRARFPFIDIHNHQWTMPVQNLAATIGTMDSMNMQVMINLSGRSGSYLQQCIQNVRSHYPKRFIVFANLDFAGIGPREWTTKAVSQLEQDVKNGANGLKIYENLGLNIMDNKGKRVAVDDPRLDPIWEKCSELKIPVLIHTGAPHSFWDPVDEHNERWLELVTHPDRKRSATYPCSWQQLMNEQHNMFRKHPHTTFIAAHFDWYGGNLDMLGKLLDSIPNMYTEFGAVIAELGRQPRRAKLFFEKYQDRILFGKDSWVPEEYTTYFRVLETEDEYFPYHKKYHAFWRMYGLGLPDEILKKIYYKNALSLLPAIDKTMFPE